MSSTLQPQHPGQRGHTLKSFMGRSGIDGIAQDDLVDGQDDLVDGISSWEFKVHVCFPQ